MKKSHNWNLLTRLTFTIICQRRLHSNILKPLKNACSNTGVNQAFLLSCTKRFLKTLRSIKEIMMRRANCLLVDSCTRWSLILILPKNMSFHSPFFSRNWTERWNRRKKKEKIRGRNLTTSLQYKWIRIVFFSWKEPSSTIILNYIRVWLRLI